MSRSLLPMVALAAPFVAGAQDVVRARPNFLVIQCDDLGRDDIGWNNPLVHTPTIDRLARESVTWENFTVNPVCAPSRATFLTGRHFLRTGVSHVHGGKDFLRLEERTLGDHLRAAGYSTGMWGKWHLGDAPGYEPWERGFTEAYKARLYRHEEAAGILNGTEMASSKWADEVMADAAIDFLRRHRSEPFFAYLPTMTPHSPHAAPERWVSFYKDRGISPGLAKIWGMVSFLDEQLGRVLGELETLGLADRTVVVFMSDNGPNIGRDKLSDAERQLRRTSGLRGWKGDLYENGVRSPLFIRWTGTLAPGRIDTPEDLCNLAPTLLDLAGVPPLPGSPPLDGKSFANLLRETRGEESGKPIFNYAHRGWLTSGPPYSTDGIPGEYAPGRLASSDFENQPLSVRRGNSKLIRNPEFASAGDEILVDLSTDPGETVDVSADHPDVRRDLHAVLQAWWEQIVREPGSFGAPVFPLADGPNTISARSPSKLAGRLINTVTGLKGWSRAGDAADYLVRLPLPAHALVSLQWKADVLPEVDFSANGERAGRDGAAALDLPAGDSILRIQLHSDVPPGMPQTPLVREAFRRFAAAVVFLDGEFGRLLSALDELGIKENTHVVFTTDHGMSGPQGKGTLYGLGTEIALLMRHPSLPSGVVRNQPVSNISMRPTLAEAAEISLTSECQGTSIWHLARCGQATDDPILFLERNFHGEKPWRTEPDYIDCYDPLRAVRTGTHLYIRNFSPEAKPAEPLTGIPEPGASAWSEWDRSWEFPPHTRPREELYDLTTDPLELRNIAGDPASTEVLNTLRTRLGEWMEATCDFPPGPPPPRAEQPGWGAEWPANLTGSKSFDSGITAVRDTR